MPGDVFNPVASAGASPAASPAAKIRESKEGKDGIGTTGKNHPSMLRVFTSNQGTQWLTVAHFAGGFETDTLLHLYYDGLVLYEGEVTLGRWCVVIKGKGLDSVAAMITKGTMDSLSVGEKENGFNNASITITSISIEPLTVTVRDD